MNREQIKDRLFGFNYGMSTQDFIKLVNDKNKNEPITLETPLEEIESHLKLLAAWYSNTKENSLVKLMYYGQYIQPMLTLYALKILKEKGIEINAK